MKGYISNDKNLIRLPRQYLSEPDGRVCHERSGEKSGPGGRVSNRLGGYPPARRKLAEHGISCEGHAARQLRNRDYEEYDLLIGMDKANLHNMFRICGGDFNNKMHLLLEYAGRPDQEVMDPWYTGDFDSTWQDVLEGCEGLLDNLM